MKQKQSSTERLVSLNKWERIICEIMGPRRKLDSDLQKRKSQRTMGSKSQIHLDYIGFIGEMAFAKMFDLYPNFTDKPDDKWDYKLKDGRTVDVKTTEFEKGKKKRLLIKTYDAPRLTSDLFALVQIDLGKLEATLKGFATKEMILNAPVLNFGYGPSFAIEMKALKNLEEL